ncbi:imidazolonepropionase [Anaerolinea thermolimosa]|uniref:imidazolonepropionase n=1 Tax=Anaerolinea thermolimosa TaxID=229919 RepID=UPI0007803803|nr:imidazolonepropionase [Anaerolinea thermolimosa]GAP08095.1 imidazolonepropionase [Anaerolinea thermolimosa]
MLIHSASQLLTLAGGPQRGRDLGRLGILEDGGVLVRQGKITAVAKSAELLAAYPDEPSISAHGKVVMPGFVDPHTHLVWAGDRAAEFELRLQGKTYMEIMASGGGIVSTVRATRQASIEALLAQTRERARRMLQYGTTTAEAKTGYGLEVQTELKQLEVLLRLDAEGPLEICPTFLGAHAIPPEYRDDPQAYTHLVWEEMLPAVQRWWASHAPGRHLPFVDVFCETGAFSLEQSRAILEQARRLGFPLKIHADEFDNLGGAALAVELGATSADHLVKTSPEEWRALAKSDTVAVALPCTPFGLAEAHYPPVRPFLEADGLLAIATDLNPGTAWCENMQFAIALACRYLHLTPAQAIAAATINAAAALGMSDRVGSLEVGKQADLVVLSVADYRHLGYRFGGNLVERVIKRGEVVV